MTIRWRYLADILTRTLILLAAANVSFAAADPMAALGSLSLYNRLLPGRTRLPFSAQPALSNNLCLYNLNAMFGSHAIAVPKPADEYRVVLLGDSSVWGAQLRNEDTRTALLNARGLTSGGKRIRFYNIGYPTISLLKDLLLMDRAMVYQPDMVIWSITLESFPAEKQVFTPIVTKNPLETRALIARYALAYPPDNPAFLEPSFLDRTIFGRRRDLADLAWLQVKGFGWAATGVDVYIPEDYDRPDNDLSGETLYYDMQGPRYQPGDLAWDVLDAGREMLNGIPLLLINEPIFLADGANSDIRYNSLYPRWAFDEYRNLLDDYVRVHGVPYMDLWNSVPTDQFTNSSIHISPEAEQGIADQIEAEIRPLIGALAETE